MKRELRIRSGSSSGNPVEFKLKKKLLGSSSNKEKAIDDRVELFSLISDVILSVSANELQEEFACSSKTRNLVIDVFAVDHTRE